MLDEKQNGRHYEKLGIFRMVDNQWKQDFIMTFYILNYISIDL